MSYMRDQHDMSYGNDYSQQRGYKPQGTTPAVQQNQAPVTYPWQAISGYNSSAAGQESFGQYDYNYGYGNDYNKSGYNQDSNKSNYNQNYNEGNFNQESNFNQNYSEDSYNQDYNEGNYNQDYNEGDYNQDYSEGNYSQDYNSGYDYASGGDGYGNEWQGEQSGGNMQWQGNQMDNMGIGRGRGTGSGNIVGRGFNNAGSGVVGNVGRGFQGGGMAKFNSGEGVGRNAGNQGSFSGTRGTGGGYDGGSRGNSGFGTGFNSGVSSGFNSGASTGFNSGVSAGFNSGVSAGFNSGASAGFNSGVSTGFGGGRGSTTRGGGSGLNRGSGVGLGRGGGVGLGRGGSSVGRGGAGFGRGGGRGGSSQSTSASASPYVAPSQHTQFKAKAPQFKPQAPQIKAPAPQIKTEVQSPQIKSAASSPRFKAPAPLIKVPTPLIKAPAPQNKARAQQIKGEASQSKAQVPEPVQTDEVDQPTDMKSLMQRWQAFAKEFADCGNSISNMECSLKASKVNHLQLSFDCGFLTKCSNFNIFSGVLNVKKVIENSPEESIFMARGHGLSKKNAKMDCYDKAHLLLITSNIQTVMSQKDSGETVLRQDLHHKYRQDPEGFLEYLKNTTAIEEETVRQSINRQALKRVADTRLRGWPENAKRFRLPDRLSEYVNDILDNKNLSLAPTKKIDVVMHPDDDLYDKLDRLKELLKEEGITKLHIVPKIDQLAHKAAIHILNVYRYETIPVPGFETRVPVFCEIYFDDVHMATGAPEYKRNAAMQKAYSTLASLLYSEPLEDLADNPRMWYPYMALDMDICSVVTKLHGRDNDAILTSNLTNMKQMMQANPDVTLSIDKMVLTEHESDKDIENVFKSLELSATRNLMLLECEIMRNDDLTFTCTLSLQGQVLARRIHATKNGAKRLCSEVIMNKMKKTHDVIFVKTEMMGKVITQQELLEAAAVKKQQGEPPAKIFKKIVEYREESVRLTPEERRRQDTDRLKFLERENAPENIRARPLFPWIAAAMYDILDEYYEKITLEDLMLDIGDMPKSQRDIVSSCAAKMGLRMVTKTKTSFDGPILRRTLTAQEMCKTLQLHGGESGRYKLVSCKNPLSQEELEQFQNECFEQHSKLVEARINDNPDADPEPLMEPSTSGRSRASSSKHGRDDYYDEPRGPPRGPKLPYFLSDPSERFLATSLMPGNRFAAPRPLMATRFGSLFEPSFSFNRRPFKRF